MKKLFLFSFLMCTILFWSCKDNGNGGDPEEINTEEYLSTAPGTHLEYAFNTDGKYKPGKRWVTFQDTIDNCYMRYTYNGELNTPGPGYGTWMFYADNDWLTKSGTGTGGNDLKAYPYFLFLPRICYDGKEYERSGVQYTVSSDQSYGAYSDCLRIDLDATSSSVDADYRGTGHYYLARNVGVVYMYFKHSEDGQFGNTGQYYSYSIQSGPVQITGKNQIYGQVVDGGFTPKEDVVVTICTYMTCNEKWFRAVTDASGNFSISLYYQPGTPISRYTLGYDADSDGRLDDTPAVQKLNIPTLNTGGHNLGQITY